MKIKVDQENCIACGTCVVLAPNTFELDENGKSIVKNEQGDSDEVILEAAKACPVSVIIVYDNQGNQLWPK